MNISMRLPGFLVQEATIKIIKTKRRDTAASEPLMINSFLAGIINLPAVCRKRGVNEKKIVYDRGC